LLAKEICSKEIAPGGGATAERQVTGAVSARPFSLSNEVRLVGVLLKRLKKEK